MTKTMDHQRARQRGALRSAVFSALLTVLNIATLSCSAETRTTSGDAATPQSGREAAEPKPGGELSVALAGETNSLNPFLGQWTASAYLVANAVYDPLAAFDEQGIAKPYLAESFTPTGDFRNWRIRLRPNITFHNGEKLDATALVKNMEANRKGIMGSQADANIAEVNAVDELTVSIDMKQPWATYPASLALQHGYVVAPAMLEDPAGAAANPIGTGPFQFQSWQRDSQLSVKRNPTYWRKDQEGRSLPYLDAVTFRILTDGTARRQALTAGDVSAIETADPDTFAAATELSREGTGQLITNEATETDEVILTFNTAKPPFNDLAARQAVAFAVDQEELSTAAYGDGAWPGAWGMFSERSPYYINREEAGYPNHDVARARQLAEQYRQTHGEALTFSTLIPAAPEALKEIQAIQAQLAEAGITMQVESADLATVISRVVATGSYQSAAFLMWSSPTPDQGYIFLALEPNASGLSLNFSRYDDPELRTAMNEFRATADPSQRIKSFKRVQKSLATNLQVLFLVHEVKGFYHANALAGVEATTFPGSSTAAYNPYNATPFLTSTWRTS